MSKRWAVVLVDERDSDIAQVRDRLIKGGFLPVSIEPRRTPLGLGGKGLGVPLRREPYGRTVAGGTRDVFVICDPCSKGECVKCLYPLDCLCTSREHNLADFERLQAEVFVLG
jgi:hypothetical protein